MWHITHTLYLALLLTTYSLAWADAETKPDLANQCEHLLNQAEKELTDAKAAGFSSTMAVTKAAGLISAARVQQTFDKFPNCIDKANRAIKYLRTSQTK